MQPTFLKHHPTSLTHMTTSAPMFAYVLVISLHLELTYLKNSPFGLKASPFQIPGPRDNKRLQDNFETSRQRHKPNKSTFKAVMPTNENDLPTMFQIRRRTFRGIESSSSPPVLGIVVHKHIVWHCQHVAINIDCCRHHDLQAQERDGGKFGEIRVFFKKRRVQ